MASRDEDFGADLALIEVDDGTLSSSGPAPARETRDWRSLYEQAHARAERERSRADAAEARAEELRWAEVDARGRAGSLKWQLGRCRDKLKAAVEETNDIRRTAKNALSLQAEVVRLGKLLSDAGVEPGKRRSIRSPSGRTRRERVLSEPAHNRQDIIKSLRAKRAELRKEVKQLNNQVARLNKRLDREVQTSERLREIGKSLSSESLGLHRQVRILGDAEARTRSLSDEVFWLRLALDVAKGANEKLTARVAKFRAAGATLSKLPFDEAAHLRNVLRRSRRQKTTIRRLHKENARLHRTVKASQTRIETLEGRYARLRASASVLQKALFGSRSEQQEKPRSDRKRGQQPGAPSHGRTQRPALEEKAEHHNPPKSARLCSCCGKPYVANGENSSTVIEIEVKAHTRRIVRPRWRRGCDCASSPLEVSAPPVARLFPRTPYGTSVWACFLYERYACLRPLHRVSAWMSDQGLPISVGTLADSVPRFLPMFEPFDEAILTHQSRAAVRHGDETVWRIQSLKETGRSSRAWLWTSVSDDAVYFHIDPSRSAKVATQLFGGTACILFLVCDRLSSYKTMAHELGGAVILCWCWAHQRRDFIHGAAGQAGLEHWCQKWIERIASIYKLNEARLEHCDPALERQTATFAQAQRVLEVEVELLFADAEQELAVLPAGARETKALRSLLNHRSGLSVFVDKPQVPMDNNAAERALREARSSEDGSRSAPTARPAPGSRHCCTPSSPR